jgi:hypothetical protein
LVLAQKKMGWMSLRFGGGGEARSRDDVIGLLLEIESALLHREFLQVFNFSTSTPLSIFY